VNYQHYTYEQLAHALYLKGESDGYSKVTDKTKWREPVMAEKLGHTAHAKISAGAGSDEYGSDAYDTENEIYAEYKSQAINDDQVRNLLGQKIGKRTAAPLTVSGVYNGAYKNSAIEAYTKVDHYFGVFYKEMCVLIVKPKTVVVISQLVDNNNKRKPGATTNLNTVKVNLADEHLYDLVYDNREAVR